MATAIAITRREYQINFICVFDWIRYKKGKNKENLVKIPAVLSYSKQALIELNPHLSIEQVDEIFNSAYDLQVTFDLKLNKFVSVKTLGYYRAPRAPKGV